MKAAALSSNRFLASLPADLLDLLRPYFRIVVLGHEDTLAKAGEPQSLVYFPHSGIISLVMALSQGELIHVAMIGRDSVFGVSTLFKAGASLNDAVVKAPGVASVIETRHLSKAVGLNVSLRNALVRHEQALLAQAQQSTACNAYHTVEARLSRWLLCAHDLFDEDTLPLTQEVLAQMIGVRRNSVSIVANILQLAGLLRYRRGHIEITNREGLRDIACECYETLKLRCDALVTPTLRSE